MNHPDEGPLGGPGGRPADDASAEPAFEQRIDDLFSRAMDQQLGEQRELTEALQRIDQALRLLEDRTADVSDAVGQSTSTAEHLTGRLAERLRTVEQAVVASLRDREELAAISDAVTQRFAEMAAAMTSVRDQVVARDADAARTLEQTARGFEEQTRRLEEVRDELVGATGDVAPRLHALLDETLAGQRQAAAQLEAAAARLDAAQASTREGFEQAVRAATDGVTGQVGQVMGDLERAVAGAVTELERQSELLSGSVGRATAELADAGARGRDEFVRKAEELLRATRDELQGIVTGVAQDLGGESAATRQAGERVAAMVADRVALATAQLQEAVRSARETLSADLRAAEAGAVQLRVAVEGTTDRIETVAQAAAELLQASGTDSAGRIAEQLDTGVATLGDAFARAEAQIEAAIERARQTLIVDAEATRAQTAELQSGLDALLQGLRHDLSGIVSRAVVQLTASAERSDQTAAAAAERLEQVSARGGEAMQEGTRQMLADLRAAVDQIVGDTATQLGAEADRAREETAALRRAAADSADGLAARIDTAVEALGALVERARTALTADAEATRNEAAAIRNVIDEVASRLANITAWEGPFAEAANTAAERLATTVSVATDEAVARFQAVEEQARWSLADQVARAGEGSAASVNDAAAAAVERLRAAIDAATLSLSSTTDELTGRVDDRSAELLQRLDDSSAGLAARVDGTRTALEELVTSAVDGLTRAVEGHAAGLQAATEEDRRALQETVAQLLDDAGQRLSQAADEATGAVAGRLTAATDELVASVGRVETTSAELARVSEEQAAGFGNLREGVRADVAAILDGLGDRAAALLAEMQERTAAATTGLEVTGGRLEDVVLGVVTELGDRLDEQATARTEQVVATVSAVTAGLVAALERAESLDERVESGVEHAVTSATESAAGQVDRMRSALDLTVEEVRRLAGRLTDAVAGFEGLQHSLVGYLTERDLLLERERDQLLADLLDEFAKGLSGRQTRRLAERLAATRTQARADAPPRPPTPPPGGPRTPPPAAGGAAPAPPDRTEAPPEPEDEAPASTTDAERAALTCGVCGFVSKTPAGLSAHRRTHRERPR
jgi:hypothetical protein